MPDRSSLAAKAGISAALGVLLTPVATIIPWVDWGLGEDSACHALIDEAQADDAAAQRKPSPGRSGNKGPAKRNAD
jgi:AsmA family protein